MLTALDVIVLFLVGGGAVLGVIRGFVTEVLSLFAWVAVVAALKLFHDPATRALSGIMGRTSAAAVLAFLILFLTVFVGGKLLAAALGRRTRQSVLGPLDRALGLGFGALKGLIGASLLFLLANLAIDTVSGGDAPRPAWMRESRTFPLLQASSRAISDWVDRRRQHRLAPAVDEPGNSTAAHARS